MVSIFDTKYTNWENGEPSQDGCCALLDYSNGQWRDIPCERVRYGLCSVCANTTMVPTNVPTNAPTTTMIPTSNPSVIPTEIPTEKNVTFMPTNEDTTTAVPTTTTTMTTLRPTPVPSAQTVTS